MPFSGWGNIAAGIDEAEVARYLQAVARLGADHMRDGITGPHSGRVGRRKDGSRFIRSAAGEFPARDSGQLLDAVKGVAFKRKAFIAADTPHSVYLRNGTGRMAPRKMTVEALQYGVTAAANLRTGFIEWLRTRNR